MNKTYFSFCSYSYDIIHYGQQQLVWVLKKRWSIGHCQDLRGVRQLLAERALSYPASKTRRHRLKLTADRASCVWGGGGGPTTPTQLITSPASSYRRNPSPLIMSWRVNRTPGIVAFGIVEEHCWSSIVLRFIDNRKKGIARQSSYYKYSIRKTATWVLYNATHICNVNYKFFKRRCDYSFVWQYRVIPW